ncbi:DUF2878 domain-containing protein [Shewanella xiamenensis]|uniref:DUF2878 domain-containing protein n=1 Tax=Shewanella xiamenensis TaxID=332186 RepID=UPI000DB368A7|nr:DUF2878 domain-containing protein [Shewanella xiamenensis]PZP33185.1 MAG: DUF2878 domain-containing protein [Shewanella oneidensis]
MVRYIQNMSKLQGVIIYSALSFQCVWWSSILWGNRVLLLNISLLLIHFLLLALVENRQAVFRDFSTMIKVGLLGIAIDTLLTLFGIFEFTVLPWWLACLWLHFALSLHHSLIFMRALPIILQVILGGVFGCLSYIAGAQFNAVTLPFGESISMIILAVVWAILLPLFIKISRSYRPVRRYGLEHRRLCDR